MFATQLLQDVRKRDADTLTYSAARAAKPSPADEGRAWRRSARCPHQRRPGAGSSASASPGAPARGHSRAQPRGSPASQGDAQLGARDPEPGRAAAAALPRANGSTSPTNPHAILCAWLGHKCDNCLPEGLRLGARHGLSFP